VPDARDFPFRMKFRLPVELPASVDLRAGCSPVEEQGTLGSCTAQALVGALEFLGIKAGAKFSDLSRLFVYYNERAREGNVGWDSGAMIRTGIKVLKKLGVCRESLWPYDASAFAQRPNAECYAEGMRHQVTAYQRLQTLDDMRTCLAGGLPFVFGFSVYENVMSNNTAKNGIVDIPCTAERMLGGHAVMAVGYDNEARRIIFRNSWGASWGQSGYGTLPYAYIADDLADDFWCIQGMENNTYAMQ